MSCVPNVIELNTNVNDTTMSCDESYRSILLTKTMLRTYNLHI